MNNLYALDETLNMLNNGRPIDYISIMYESIDNEIAEFNILVESFINEKFDIKATLTKAIEKIKNIIKKIKENIKRILDNIKTKVISFVSKLKNKKLTTDEEVKEKAINGMIDKNKKFIETVAGKAINEAYDPVANHNIDYSAFKKINFDDFFYITYDYDYTDKYLNKIEKFVDEVSFYGYTDAGMISTPKSRKDMFGGGNSVTGYTAEYILKFSITKGKNPLDITEWDSNMKRITESLDYANKVLDKINKKIDEFTKRLQDFDENSARDAISKLGNFATEIHTLQFKLGHLSNLYEQNAMELSKCYRD